MSDNSQNFITPEMWRAFEDLRKLHPPSEHELWRARVGYLMGSTNCSWDEVVAALARQGMHDPSSGGLRP